MLKVISPNDFNFDQNVMSIVDLHSRGVDSTWLSKSAAVLTKEMRALRPEKGVTNVHLIALGDMETTGNNRNYDGFPKKANQEYHRTFVDHGKWYHDHKNKPARGDKIYGNIKHSAYNEEMGRVELIIGINDKDDPDSIEKLANGEDLNVSMSCVIPYDVCSYCGHKATKKSEYCVCIKENLGKLTKEGKQISMINTKPTFFDISRVNRNADRIAFTLQKVASIDSETPVLSVDVAAAYGITAPENLIKDSAYTRRLDLLRKLAVLEKTIEGEITTDPSQKAIASALNEPMGIPNVDAKQLNSVLGSLADARVSLPFEEFIKVVLGNKADSVKDIIPEAKEACRTIFRDALSDTDSFLNDIKNYQPLDLSLPKTIKESVRTAIRGNSLCEEVLKRKVAAVTMRKSASLFVQYEKRQVTKAAQVLASEYGKYKLAFLEHIAAEPFVTKLSVLQDFVY